MYSIFYGSTEIFLYMLTDKKERVNPAFNFSERSHAPIDRKRDKYPVRFLSVVPLLALSVTPWAGKGSLGTFKRLQRGHGIVKG